ncbi:MAG: hypothetical protein ACR5KW_02830 [Wolbachia sp.]
MNIVFIIKKFIEIYLRIIVVADMKIKGCIINSITRKILTCFHIIVV